MNKERELKDEVWIQSNCSCSNNSFVPCQICFVCEYDAVLHLKEQEMFFISFIELSH